MIESRRERFGSLDPLYPKSTSSYPPLNPRRPRTRLHPSSCPPINFIAAPSFRCTDPSINASSYLASVMTLHCDRTLDPRLLPRFITYYLSLENDIRYLVQPIDCSISISSLVLASYLLLSFCVLRFIAFHLVPMFILSFFCCLSFDDIVYAPPLLVLAFFCLRTYLVLSLFCFLSFFRVCVIAPRLATEPNPANDQRAPGGVGFVVASHPPVCPPTTCYLASG
jgi:hypothetical protein